RHVEHADRIGTLQALHRLRVVDELLGALALRGATELDRDLRSEVLVMSDDDHAGRALSDHALDDETSTDQGSQGSRCTVSRRSVLHKPRVSGRARVYPHMR